MTTPKFNEDTLSEKPAIEQLKRMGYLHIPGEKLDPQETEDCERAGRREVVLAGRLKRKLAELNLEATEETLDKAIRHATNIQGTGLLDENRTFHRELVSSISIDQDEGAKRRKITVRFIDFDHPERNEFLAVNQFWVKGPKPPDRKPDIAVFVNGIPLAVIECKSPVNRQAGIQKAVKDLIFYQDAVPSLFRTSQILIGVNVFKARYGVVGADPEDFHEWRAPADATLPKMSEHPAVQEMRALGLLLKEELGQMPAAQDALLASLLNKKNLLDIIRNFIVFDTSQGRTKKKICRYQQFTAAQKIVERALEPRERKGIIWHWQGSGKSLTMVFAALKLKREEQRLKNPYLLVITDRKQLDRQIAGTFKSCGFPNLQRAESARDLYGMLAGGVGQTIMTTVQKFNVDIDKPLSESANIIVLTDEAHRTQYGTFALNLRKALPNAAIFAFTGTPLDKRERNTYRVFSREGESYLDRYTPRQSEEDGATVPIKYASRLPSLQIVGATLDSLLANLFPDKTAQELADIKRVYATVETLASAPARIERTALDIAEHYSRFIKPNGLKAMVVTETREAADAYKRSLDRVMDPARSAVAMTLNDKTDPKEWKEKYALTEEEEENLKEAYADPENHLDFLIVCDKLLTGFDAPNLQAMYLDKRLREHTLLQAVARCNRPYPGKNYGLIVDYAGFGKELAEAVSMFNPEDLEGLFRVDDIERELERLKDQHQAAMASLAGISLDGTDPKATLQRCVDALQEPDVRGRFNEAYRAFAKSMDFLMPDPRVAPYLKDLKFLGIVREGCRTQYRDDRLSAEDLGPKVRDLIHAHIAAEGVEEILQPLIITAPDFQERLNARTSDKAKAAHLEYAIRASIQERWAEDPAFYGSLKDQLEQLIDKQKRERLEEAQLLLALMPLRDQELRKDKLAQSLGLEPGPEHAFFNLIDSMKDKLPPLGREEQVAVVKEVIRIVRGAAVTGWTEREDIQKEMRREIKRFLRTKGCQEEHLPEIVGELMGLAQHRLRR